jgi:integrase
VARAIPVWGEGVGAVYKPPANRNRQLADPRLIDAWTGLRWSELRAIRVPDLVRCLPIMMTREAAPNGVAVKVMKSEKSRRVPIAGLVLPIVRRWRPVNATPRCS